MSRLQPIQPFAEADTDRDQPVRQPSGFASVWLSAAEAAAYLRCPSVRAFYMWRKRHGIEARHRGARLLFARADLDRAIGVVILRRR